MFLHTYEWIALDLLLHCLVLVWHLTSTISRFEQQIVIGLWTWRQIQACWWGNVTTNWSFCCVYLIVWGLRVVANPLKDVTFFLDNILIVVRSSMCTCSCWWLSTSCCRNGKGIHSCFYALSFHHQTDDALLSNNKDKWCVFSSQKSSIRIVSDRTLGTYQIDLCCQTVS